MTVDVEPGLLGETDDNEGIQVLPDLEVEDPEGYRLMNKLASLYVCPYTNEYAGSGTGYGIVLDLLGIRGDLQTPREMTPDYLLDKLIDDIAGRPGERVIRDRIAALNSGMIHIEDDDVTPLRAALGDVVERRLGSRGTTRVTSEPQEEPEVCETTDHVHNINGYYGQVLTPRQALLFQNQLNGMHPRTILNRMNFRSSVLGRENRAIAETVGAHSIQHAVRLVYARDLLAGKDWMSDEFVSQAQVERAANLDADLSLILSLVMLTDKHTVYVRDLGWSKGEIADKNTLIVELTRRIGDGINKDTQLAIAGFRAGLKPLASVEFAS